MVGGTRSGVLIGWVERSGAGIAEGSVRGWPDGAVGAGLGEGAAGCVGVAGGVVGVAIVARSVPSSGAGTGALGGSIETALRDWIGGVLDEAVLPIGVVTGSGGPGVFSTLWIFEANSLSIRSLTSTLLTLGLSLSGWITLSPNVAGRWPVKGAVGSGMDEACLLYTSPSPRD